MARQLTEAEKADWQAAMRHVRRRGTADAPVAPPSAPPPPAPAPAPARPARDPAAPRVSTAGPLTIGVQPAGLDTATWERLRSGRLSPTRTIDLHGRTVQSAHNALATFLSRAHADRVRVIEVVTGGTATRGAIRRELQVWLNLPPLRPLVLAAAYPHAANQGAVRLLLRKPR